jgi:hypothetical protein
MLKRFRRIDTNSNKSMKIHGAKECARRVKQMNSPNPNISIDQTMAHHLARKLIT